MADADAFRRLLDFLQEPVLILDTNGTVTDANAAARALFGREPVGAPLSDLTAGETERLPTFLRRCSGSARPLIGSLVLRTPEGARKLQVQGAAYGRPEPGRPAQVILRCRPEAVSEFSVLARKVQELNREVRQRRRAQAALEEALRHKDMLLHELHHRVKNHTQMLLGMLSVTARDADSPELRRFLDALRSRLLAIGAAQQLMYQADKLDAVPAREFIGRLCGAIAETWPKGVALSHSAEDVELRNDVTASLALIVNELTANALKHGLGFGQGRIVVTLGRDGGEILLTVSDSGGKWSESPAARRSSGLSLVRGLCRQIGGSFDIRGGERTVCTVRFPYHAAEPVAS